VGLAPERGLSSVAGFGLCVARVALILVTKRGVLDPYAPILVFEGVNAVQSTCTLYFMEPIQIIGNIYLKTECIQSKMLHYLGGRGKDRVAIIKSLIYARVWKRRLRGVL